MQRDDFIVYYSPTEQFQEKEKCQKFTAIGKVSSGEPYQFEMSKDFIPWRKNVHFFEAKEASIIPMIDMLSFIRDKKRWGFPFRWGCFSVPHSDFQLIASSMGVSIQ